MSRRPSAAGFTLIELSVLLVLFALLSAMAVPSLSSILAHARARAALDRLAGDLFFARAVAARSGRPVYLRFVPATGCADGYLLVGQDDTVLRRVRTGREGSGVCLTSNVSRAMGVNSRGMLIGSPRTLHARSGRAADSATVSMVGRIYRWP